MAKYVFGGRVFCMWGLDEFCSLILNVDELRMEVRPVMVKFEESYACGGQSLLQDLVYGRYDGTGNPVSC